MGGIARRTFMAGLGTTGLAFATCRVLAQQSYPAGLTIKFVVPFPAGGTVDFVGRIVADRLGALWKVATVVENVPGAGGNIGIDRVAKGPTDGTQILIVPPGIATNQFMSSRLAYDPERDIVPLSQVASLPNLLCARKGLPVDSVAALIAYAKANPGKLNYASSGVGTTLHLSAELFKRMAGVDMVHVAYRGGAPALNDLVGGNVDLIFANIPTIIGQARAGAVKPLGITISRRSSFAPEYPPIADAVPGYDVTSWSGVGVRAGTPKEICDTIERDTRAVCQEQVVRERLGTQVAETIGSSAMDFANYIAEERKKWGKLISDLNLRVQ
jgi:tripartite-type tricarboxylate transporter receptor subunit TctC